MALLVQLSDLHLLANPVEQEGILDALVAALHQHYAGRGRRADLLAITGDVFDSVTVPPREATRCLGALLERVREALGGDVPTVIIPGNHDRRQSGLVGPHRPELFLAVRDALGDQAWVHGCRTPFLADVVPQAVHRLPLAVVAYDSTYLPRGLIGAGGLLRQEDLLSAAAAVAEAPPDWPVLFLLHHHLVPTPITDLGRIEAETSPHVLRWSLARILPELIANGDREELTMTALGAGTALSTLHALERAVLVLHGHKHYATARLLHGMGSGHGDVLVVSAGSAGTAERWSPTANGDAARLWPSFNAIELDGDRLEIDVVSFGYKGSSAAKVARRALVRARRHGASWHAEPVRDEPLESTGPRLGKNESICRVLPSPAHGEARWDYECERSVTRADAARPHAYIETVEGIAGSRVEMISPTRGMRDVPARIELQLDGRTLYRHAGGLCRTVAEDVRLHGPGTAPFEWLGLMNRYESGLARLTVHALGPMVHQAFASATDLGTGLETPMRLRRDVDAGTVELSYPSCPPRTLLRVYWPLRG